MAGFSRNNPAVYWWSLDALLGADELFQALSRFPTLTIINDRRLAGDTGDMSLEDYVANYESYLESLTCKMSLEDYVANYESYLESLTCEKTFDRKVHNKLQAEMTLDASILTNPMRPDHPALRGFGYCPVLRASSFEMEYHQQANRMRVTGHGRTNPIYFGISLAHPNVWNVALTDIPESDIRNWFPNVDLIEGLTEWVMKHSEPCKIMLPGREQVLPVRLGRQASRWVNEHTGLARQGLSVRTSRPVKADLSWLTPPVLHLARVIRDETDFTALPILSDALEEAGCADEMVLRHCRSQREHVRSCWVVDMLLADR